jgi:hypothetical protein
MGNRLMAERARLLPTAYCLLPIAGRPGVGPAGSDPIAMPYRSSPAIISSAAHTAALSSGP